MPTLFLTCGLPGSGKTTLAKQIEAERPALRLTADEWLFELFGPEPESPEVVIDWGVWSRAERDDYRVAQR
jgi:predicted kinase